MTTFYSVTSVAKQSFEDMRFQTEFGNEVENEVSKHGPGAHATARRQNAEARLYDGLPVRRLVRATDWKSVVR